jgi:hypothetical protein
MLVARAYYATPISYLNGVDLRADLKGPVFCTIGSDTGERGLHTNAEIKSANLRISRGD